MPRLARLDAPGVLHHIMIRGIERRKIFLDNKDREDFLDRLSELLPETETLCYAWAFLPNHAHFLLRTGTIPLATLMRRLLTGYVVSFNYSVKNLEACKELEVNAYVPDPQFRKRDIRFAKAGRHPRSMDKRHERYKSRSAGLVWKTLDWMIARVS